MESNTNETPTQKKKSKLPSKRKFPENGEDCDNNNNTNVHDKQKKQKTIQNQNVRWRKKHETWLFYDEEANKNIETAYQSNKKTFKLDNNTTIKFNKQGFFESQKGSKQAIPVERLELDDHIAAACKELIHLFEATKYQDEEMKLRKKFLTQTLQEFLLLQQHKQNPPKPKKRIQATKLVTADEAYDWIKDMAFVEPSSWTNEQIETACDKVREVACFCMRGSQQQSKQALDSWMKKWATFVESNPEVKKMLDPEVVVLDVNWTPPDAFGASLVRANANLSNTLGGLPIPAIPVGSPEGFPPVPATGVSDVIFATNGPVDEACAFGAMMTGLNHTSLRGFWRVTTALPPTYYS